MKRNPNLCIEPSRGATYANKGKFAVYEYSTYPRGSVLAGQQRRVFHDEFDSVEAARKAYPQASVSASSNYQAPSLSHLPDPDGPDPLGENADAAAEHVNG